MDGDGGITALVQHTIHFGLLTDDEYNRLIHANRYLGARGRLCPMCFWNKAAHHDHCHTCGQWRGWLCVACNLRLGRLEKNWTRREILAHHWETFIGRFSWAEYLLDDAQGCGCYRSTI